jgi:hypothetical protein
MSRNIGIIDPTKTEGYEGFDEYGLLISLEIDISNKLPDGGVLTDEQRNLLLEEIKRLEPTQETSGIVKYAFTSFESLEKDKYIIVFHESNRGGNGIRLEVPEGYEYFVEGKLEGTESAPEYLHLTAPPRIKRESKLIIDNKAKESRVEFLNRLLGFERDLSETKHILPIYMITQPLVKKTTPELAEEELERKSNIVVQILAALLFDSAEKAEADTSFWRLITYLEQPVIDFNGDLNGFERLALEARLLDYKEIIDQYRGVQLLFQNGDQKMRRRIGVISELTGVPVTKVSDLLRDLLSLFEHRDTL